MTGTTTVVSTFPQAEIEAQLQKELLHAIETEASLLGVSLPASIPDRIAMSMHVDSLVAVEILCTVEPIVGFELEDRIVRAGGYKSVDEAVKVLMPRVEKEWNKRKGKLP